MTMKHTASTEETGEERRKVERKGYS